MSKVEHDPALVRWLENILRLVAKDENAGDGLAEEIIEEIAKAVRAWDAEHAEPSVAEQVWRQCKNVSPRGDQCYLKAGHGGKHETYTIFSGYSWDAVKEASDG